MATAIIVGNTAGTTTFAAELNTVEVTTVNEANENTTNTEINQGTNQTQLAITDETTTLIEAVATDAIIDATQNTIVTTQKECEVVKQATVVKEVAKQTTVAKTSTVKTAAKKTTKKAVKYTKAQVRILASLIYAEAGSESYAGKLAVGIIVMNRVQSKRFPSTLTKVIYQRSQFGPVRNGALNKALSQYDNNRFNSYNEKQCIKAAKEALNGTNKITYKKNGKTQTKNLSSYLFFSGRLSNARFSLGGHQFK
jgi:spore germination cell wall hydrolase CwlJ-like protein